MQLLDIATYFTSESDVSRVRKGPLADADLQRLYAYPPRPRRPWIRANFVSSIDGAVTAGGLSAGLGTPADQAVFTVLRTLADAVLVGAGTVRAENYGGVRFSTDEQERRSALGLAPIPPVVVVTASAHISPDARIFTDTEVPPIVVTAASASPDARRALATTGARVVETPGDNVSTAAILAALDDLGLHRVLCEGGPGLFGQLLNDDAVDDVCLTTAPLLVAGGAGRISHSSTSSMRRMTRAHVVADDDGTLLTRWVKHRPSA
ncbi:pyrimidine reductase family protein [Rhodococcus sp. G-MC3]|uniref:pyrimidine reductase family protein n=1 Tax=Rhodococcus sp. G-MC3 TaxID=3046209 RepID=UPI0024B93A9D|nr:pyrimidine reductase family protein [Rhodococcus sp. G-MC3]MDJ0395471.1 pyrimidine reductase family protein [Rhodococcus sp. G-MC3]